MIYDLDVPDFSKKELTMSGVVLRGPSEPEGMFLPAGDPLQALRSGRRRRCGCSGDGDKVAVFAEIYDTTGGRAHTLDVRAEIRSESGEVTPVGTASRSSGDPEERRRHGAIRAQLPIGEADAGSLRALGGRQVERRRRHVTRSVPFRVRLIQHEAAAASSFSRSSRRASVLRGRPR